jgi:protocatechuate 3,4-dioxygenase beta subunit
VGEGYVLFGTVRSARSCQPVPGARIEIWLTNPQGVYDDAHRATVVADAAGDYRFESARPPRYGFRPPHVHLRITADGFATLVTQHYPEASVSEARFDLVLVHAEK